MSKTKLSDEQIKAVKWTADTFLLVSSRGDRVIADLAEKLYTVTSKTIMLRTLQDITRLNLDRAKSLNSLIYALEDCISDTGNKGGKK